MELEAKIRRSLRDSGTLPAMASVVTRLMTLVGEGAGARDVGDALSMDTALSSRVLRVANSSLYAVAGRATTVQKAVTLLGAEAVRNLALTFSVLDIFPLNSSKIFNYPRFWAFSLEVAVLARALASQRNDVDADEAFTAGLMHNMGVLFLARTVPEDYSECLKIAEAQGLPLHKVERDRLGIDHCEVGRDLADAWTLPELIGQVAAFHHEPAAPEAMDAETGAVCDTVIVAARLAHLLEANDWNTADDSALQEVLEGLDFDVDSMRQALAGTFETVTDTAEAYGLGRLANAIRDPQYKALTL